MNVEYLAHIIEEMMPTLLQKKTDSVDWGSEIVINFDGEKVSYITYNTSFNHGDQLKIKQYIENRACDYLALKLNSLSMEKEWICRDICAKWLELKSKIKQEEWLSIIEYCKEQTNRTYENMPVVWNFILDPDIDEENSASLRNSSDGKLLDLLAGSNYTFFRLDSNLNITSYDCVNWNETADKTSYSSVPNFLQPYWKKVTQGKIGISITHAGDILIYSNPGGMLVSIRKGRCTLYENACVKNMFLSCLKCRTQSPPYSVACNIFDAAWDLSYRRHGALIIASDDKSYKEHIVNKGSIFDSEECTGIRNELRKSFDNVRVDSLEKKSIFLEMASVDGAVVVNTESGRIEAFGSIIETHPNAAKENGARTTAAKSAIWHGHMYPVKVSSDGDITLYVRTKISKTEEEAILEYKFY